MESENKHYTEEEGTIVELAQSEPVKDETVELTQGESVEPPTEETVLNHYRVMLKSGVFLDLERDDPIGKSVVGLWVWALRNANLQTHTINFNNFSILTGEIIAMEQVESGGTDYAE